MFGIRPQTRNFQVPTEEKVHINGFQRTQTFVILNILMVHFVYRVFCLGTYRPTEVHFYTHCIHFVLIILG